MVSVRLLLFQSQRVNFIGMRQWLYNYSQKYSEARLCDHKYTLQLCIEKSRCNTLTERGVTDHIHSAMVYHCGNYSCHLSVHPKLDKCSTIKFEIGKTNLWQWSKWSTSIGKIVSNFNKIRRISSLLKTPWKESGGSWGFTLCTSFSFFTGWGALSWNYTKFANHQYTCKMCSIRCNAVTKHLLCGLHHQNFPSISTANSMKFYDGSSILVQYFYSA